MTEQAPTVKNFVVLTGAGPNGENVKAQVTYLAGQGATAAVGIEGADGSTQASDSNPVPVKIIDGGNAVEYETVAASQTAQVIGATGAIGDYMAGLLVIPATTSPGNVLLLDNVTSITVFTGGASSVSNLVPFFIPIQAKSVSGAWKLTTGANVSVFAVGNFT